MHKRSVTLVGLALFAVAGTVGDVSGTEPGAKAREATAPPQSIMLNAGGDVTRFALSMDELTAVYLADQNTGGVIELFSVPASGGRTTRLNGSLVPGGQVTDFRISPDSAFVVYRADEEIDERFDLYAVPLTGGPAIRLNPPGSTGVAEEFEISPDATRVVYLDRDADWFDHVVPHVIPISGGAPIKLNPMLPAGAGGVGQLLISPQGNYVAFQEQNTSGRMLWSATLDGDAVVRLEFPTTGALWTQVRLWGTFAGDESRLVYEVQDDGFANQGIVSSAPDGSDNHLVTEGNMISGNLIRFWAVSPEPVESRHMIAYIRDFVTGPDPYSRVWSRTLDGSLGGGLLFDGVGDMILRGTVGAIAISDAGEVVFDAEGNLWRAPITGGPRVLLTDGPGEVAVDFQFSSDDTFVVVRTGPVPAQQRLWSAPLAGGPVSELASPLRFIHQHRISPDSSAVTYVADREIGGPLEVRAVPIQGGARFTLSQTPDPGGGVQPGISTIGADGLRVIFRFVQGAGQDAGLFGAMLVPDDDDADGVLDADDNCLSVPNPGQTDGDGDGLGDLCDNCPLVANAGQVDVDGDDAGSACDCDDDDAGAFSIPPSVTGLVFAPALDTELRWDPAGGGSVVVYAVIRGNLSGFPVGDEVSEFCLAAGVTEPTLSVPDEPSIGNGYWYLVQAGNGCGAGPVGPGIERRPVTCYGCPHGICQVGLRLEPVCDPCALEICAQMPSCCDTEWDSGCVAAVLSVCGSFECPGSTPGCDHGLCEVGEPLTPECDVPPVTTSCVSAVCDVDPVCCNQIYGTWDGLCISEALEICGVFCGNF